MAAEPGEPKPLPTTPKPGLAPPQQTSEPHPSRTTPLSVTGVAALADLPAPLAAEAVTVLGVAKPGDGGGGIFWYDPVDTTTPANTGTAIHASDGHRWKRLYSGPLNALWFPGDDLGAKLNHAIASAVRQGQATDGVTIYIPSGNYTVTTPVHCNVTGLAIYGDGNRTLLRWANTNDYLFTLGDGVPSKVDHCSLHDLFIICNNNAKAIHVLRSTVRAYLTDLRIFYPGIGIRWSDGEGSTWAGVISSIEIQMASNEIGMFLDNFDDCSLLNCRVITHVGATNSTGVIIRRTGSAARIMGNNIERNPGDDLIITNCPGPINIAFNHFETVAHSDVCLRLDKSAENINILGNVFNSNLPGANLLTINEGVRFVRIDNLNQFNFCTKAAILNKTTSRSANIFIGQNNFLYAAGRISSDIGVSEWSPRP